MELKHRDIQTRIKHEILKQYLVKWYSIITMGLRGQIYQFPKMRDNFRARFIYVDYFSFTGAYEDGGELVDGSPVIGIKALDGLKTFSAAQTGGLVPRTNAILFEDNGPTFQALVETLTRLGWADRLRRLGDSKDPLRDGEILLIFGDSSQYVDRVLQYLENNGPVYSFHFIDPYGAKSVEWQNVERIVSMKGADSMINMMFDPIYRFLVPAAQEDARSAELAKAEYFDKFFGPVNWRQVAHDMAYNVLERGDVEDYLVGNYERAIKTADSALGVKRIRLKFAERDQSYYYLFLTTHDSDGAFELNEILWEADLRQYDYREELRRMKEHADQMPLGFFGDIVDEKRPIEPEPDIDYLAKEIQTICKGRALTYKQVLDAMINSPYFKSDIRAALGRLKEQKHATFDVSPSSMTNKSLITF